VLCRLALLSGSTYSQALAKTVTVKPQKTEGKMAEKWYLYVAMPGIRDYLGHGLLVFDMHDDHRLSRESVRKGCIQMDNRPM
jgi:hypothetical protein